MQKLNGPFKDILPGFQKYKKSLGYKYDNIYDFKSLDIFLAANQINNLDNSKKIFEVAVLNNNNNNRKKYYFCLKELYDYLKRIGYKNLYFEKIYFKNDEYSNIKILTTKEIKILFENIDKNYTNDNQLYSVIFRLIYSCGLRIGETINLKINDFSLENRDITIHNGKNNISRIIPLSDSMFQVLKKYLNTISNKNQIYLFEKNDKKIDQGVIRKVFKNSCPIQNARVHDLRHTFAVHTLDNLFKNNIQSKEALYPLSIYMGHTTIESTEYYLRFTKEYYKNIQKKMDKNFYPKVGTNYEQ